MNRYGLRGISHGGSNLIHVMGDEGIGFLIANLDFDVREIRSEFYPGVIPQYHEMVDGGLDRFVARHGIVELDFRAWTARKAELGDTVYR